MTHSRAPFYHWLDLFRFLAAALVAVSHVRDIVLVDYPGEPLFLPFYALTGFGHSGVIVFFVLSGFWISRSVLNRLDRDGFWPSYLIDRLVRLEIVLLPALLLGGLLDWAGMQMLQLPLYAGTSGSHSIAPDLASHFGAEVFTGNLAFLQTIIVPAWGSNGPLWSLANEFWYYLWFPALALALRKRRPGLALLSLVVALANPSILLGFASWLVGFALLKLLERASPHPWQRFRLAVAASALLGALLTASAIKLAVLDLPLALAFGWFLYELAQAEVPFPGWLARLARYGSTSSFSLYAIHFPIAALVGGWLARTGRLPPSPGSLALVLAVTALCVAAGWLFSLASERHTADLRRWLKQRLIPQPAD